MEGSEAPGLVAYEQKQYREIILNSATEDQLPQTEVKNNSNTVYVSSLADEEEEPTVECHNLCEEKEIQKTIPCASLYEQYVSKKVVLLSGIKGLCPHSHSICEVIIESIDLLDSSFLDVVHQSPLFVSDKINVVVSVEIGSSNDELGRALELALLDMFEGEKSQVILHAHKREEKLRDQVVLPSPCLRCIINLKKVKCATEFTGTPLKDVYLLSLLSFGDTQKYRIGLHEKLQGVKLFQQGQFVDAFHRFAAGVKILLTCECFLLESEKEKDLNILNLYSTLCSNMAECQLKENNPTQAITLCRKALLHDPSNLKAIYRQAAAAWTLGDVDQADSCLKRLFELDPENAAAKRLNSEVQVKIKGYLDEYTIMMKRIFQY